MKQNNQKVSVIMPAYNSSHYVEESISSVLNQTHRNIELIVIDDGSTDETWTIINAWSERDDRIIAMRQKNQGVSLVYLYLQDKIHNYFQNLFFF